MIQLISLIQAGFTAPLNVGTDPQSMLWFLPLAATIAIVYKATKLPEIKFANFLKETAIVFASIVVFMALVAVALMILAWFFTS